MTIIRYFCTGGYTETGGIKTLLEKINPRIVWKREFPAVSKPGPRVGTPSPTPNHNGMTGNALVQCMMNQLSQFPSDHRFDGVLLIDDADCRFDTIESFIQWLRHIESQVQEIVGEPIPFYALFASPEIEAWLLSDWNNSMEKEYGQYFSHRFKAQLGSLLGESYPWGGIELFGMPMVNNSCSTKLSSVIQNVFRDPIFMSQFAETLTNVKLSYSKRINGASMLQRINPETVSKNCRTYFTYTYLQLAAL